MIDESYVSSTVILCPDEIPENADVRAAIRTRQKKHPKQPRILVRLSVLGTIIRLRLGFWTPTMLVSDSMGSTLARDRS